MILLIYKNIYNYLLFSAERKKRSGNNEGIESLLSLFSVKTFRDRVKILELLI